MTPGFFRLHSGLAHEAPGSAADTLRALALTGFPGRAGRLRALDLGCGPGAASVALLGALPEAEVTGVDLHAPFVAAARARAEPAGLGARFRGVVGDMLAPPAAPGGVDLVWCEGAAYAVGLGVALRAWRPLLEPGGRLGLSELVWTTASPDPEAAAFFGAEYPPMTDAAGVRAAFAAAGWRVTGAFLVLRAGWEAYYGPLAARAEALASEFGDDPALAETRAEIAVWRAHGADFGYSVFVAEPA